MSHKFPNELLLGLNDRDEQFHDLYRLNLTTGERTLVAKNDQNLLGFVTDDDYQVRFAMKYGPTGGRELLEADGMGGFKPFAQIPMEDDLTTSPAGFDKTGDILYMLDSRGRNTAALTSYDLKSKETKVVAANDKADVGGVLSHPTEHTVERSRSTTRAKNGRFSTKRFGPRSNICGRSTRASCKLPAARSTTSSGSSPSCAMTAR